MIDWTDISDRHSRLFAGTFTHEPTLSDALQCMLEFAVVRLIGIGNANSFDYLLLEVGLDTGRVILALTTLAAHSRGKADGCSVRLQSLQDIWYEIVDAAPPDDTFSEIVTKHIRDVGTTFLELLPDALPPLLNASSPDGFTFRLFGGDPGISIMDQHFPSV